jgi:hypothetical protein
MKTKFAIGCLVQWYECEIIEEYVNSLKEAIKNYDGEVIVDFYINSNQDLEKCISPNKLEECLTKIRNILLPFNVIENNTLFTIADYRRKFLEEYHNKAEVLIQGESDALMPRQTFTVLDMLHQQVKDTTPKYISTFGICKMWDNSWKPLEHKDFTDKPFKDLDFDNWWSHHYTMTLEEMNSFNNKVEDLEIINIKPHKFNGCGFIISSDTVKAGVNVPRGAFFIDDSALLAMAHKILPDMPQYHFQNILIVHNRHHPKKRMYVKDESGANHEKRLSNNWYNIANNFCKINDANIFNPSHKFYTWDDVWEKIKK